jgi:hypothetical protein
MQGIQ